MMRVHLQSFKFCGDVYDGLRLRETRLAVRLNFSLQIDSTLNR
ncbi:MAG: hypothetical protein V7K42_02600 [Nostoc sp.]